jgi:hypothetical protein
MSRETDKGSGGHVFIIPGRVQDLACDAWCISCDVDATPGRKWLPRHILERKRRYEWGKPPSGWGNDGVRAFKLSNWEKGTPQPWVLNVGGHEQQGIKWYIAGVEQFFEAVAADLKGHDRLYKRAKHLVALPAVGTGRGGLRHQAGEVAQKLLPVLYRLAKKYDLDIALVLPHASTFAAAQDARSVLPDETIWPTELTDKLRKTAEDLARHASQGKLALFLGAGVSNSAGLPLWSGLLDQLATIANIADKDWNEVKCLKLSVLDQAAIIERSLKSQEKLLGDVIRDVLLEYHGYSLTHALLAGLPVREAVTTNFDQLFEDAWTEHRADGKSKRPPVLPYETGPDLDRWLLKLHGCVSHPKDIVFTRADFIRYAEERGALTGVVQTLLITRHLLIVGFSLDDPNFHEIIDAVRRVLERRTQEDGKNPLLGTALMTERKPLVARLSSELEWVSTGQEATFNTKAGRLQQIFLDYMSSRVRNPSRLVHLLNDRYEGVLTGDERALAETLRNLGQSLSQSDRSAPAWDVVKEWLASLGYPFPREHRAHE